MVVAVAMLALTKVVNVSVFVDVVDVVEVVSVVTVVNQCC